MRDMSKEITFTVHRNATSEFKATVPDDFDTSDEWALIELSYSEAEEIDGTTHELLAELIEVTKV